MSALAKDQIQNNDLRLISFQSLKECSKVISLLRKDEELKNFPWTTGPLSIIISSNAIPLLKAKGLTFRVIDPIIESNLTPKQDMALKKDKAILFGCWGATFFLERVSSY